MLLRSALALLVAVALPLGAAAGDGLGHDEARRAVERGEIRPLAEILDTIRPELAGTVVGVELKRGRRGLVYEFKTLDGDGRRREIYVDAATARVRKIEDDD